MPPRPQSGRRDQSTRISLKRKQYCAIIQCPRNSHYRWSSRDKENNSKWGKLEFYPQPHKYKYFFLNNLSERTKRVRKMWVWFHIYVRYRYRMSYIKFILFLILLLWKRKSCLASLVTFRFNFCQLLVLSGDWLWSWHLNKVIGT